MGSMEKEIADRLIQLNREFYQLYSISFSQTRRRIQPGVARVLHALPDDGVWLDIGCGNGNLIVHWAHQGFHGSITGVDFSQKLIQQAREYTAQTSQGNIDFHLANIADKDWASALPHQDWNGIFLFAVLHHIPGKENRRKACAQLRGLLQPGSCCYLSVWQPHKSKRLSRRFQPWTSMGFREDQVETGDVLMDWRAESQKEPNRSVFRYVHIFEGQELSALAQSCGFFVQEQFFSDGRQGNLGLYQRWQVR